MTDKRKPHDALAGIRAILPAENEPASGDWKLVPVEPTEEMLRGVVCFGNTPGQVYKAMLAAAPSADLTELRALVEKWLSGDKFRDGEDCAGELEALIERMGDGELARLERELAGEFAISLVESSGVRFGVDKGWLGRSDDDCLFDDSLRYLELRDLLERHPENRDWVRVKEAADGMGG